MQVLPAPVAHGHGLAGREFLILAADMWSAFKSTIWQYLAPLLIIASDVMLNDNTAPASLKKHKMLVFSRNLS